MLYNLETSLPAYKTAGKITILTALFGVLVFVVAFMFDAGSTELQRVAAQTATTSLTVLNTPPSFTTNAFEVVDSSTTTPTNSGSIIQWSAVATDANASDYYLLICESDTPAPVAATSTAPSCGPGVTQWGVSVATPSDTAAFVSTTTTETTPFGEQNVWYAWVCDNDPNNPECNVTPVQGPTSTTAFSSPFNVNRRPVFNGISNNGPVDPNGILTYTATATDPDIVPGEDDIFLAVCGAQTFSTTTRDCGLDTLATTTVGVVENPTATFQLPAVQQDDTYAAFVYVFDEHGHTANGLLQGTSSDFVVNNVAPEVNGGDISLNNGQLMILSQAGGETTGFTLQVTVTDANSCVNTSDINPATSSDNNLNREIEDIVVSVFRTSIGTTTCNGSAYNPNNCYGSLNATTTWNLVCTASSTSCLHTDTVNDDSQVFNCTFPLWFVAEPTDDATNTPAILELDNWSAAAYGVDDNNATNTLVISDSGVELRSFTAFSLLTSDILYGELAPGFDTVTLRATTTFNNLGNTGIDQEIYGDDMCDGYSPGNPCTPSLSATIPADQQRFASTTLLYSNPSASVLSSTTPTLANVNAPKTTSTSTPIQRNTFFGIAVPSSITFSGDYTGMNTFMAVPGPAATWGI
jgi:hypothetical protein